MQTQSASLKYLALTDSKTPFQRLAKLQQLRWLTYGGLIPTKALAFLSKLKKLQVLKLYVADFGDGRPPDRVVAHDLRVLGELQALTLGMHLTKKMCRALGHATQLRALRLPQRVTSSCYKHLAALPELEQLAIETRQLRDVDLVQLAKMRKLKALSLTNTSPSFSDQGIAHLASLSGLEALHMPHSSISDSGLAQLARLPRLRYLALNGKRLTDAGMSPLVNLKPLRVLILEQPRLSGKGLAKLAGLPQLRILVLDRPQIAPTALAKLRQVSSLRILVLRDVQISAANLATLRRKLAPLYIAVKRPDDPPFYYDYQFHNYN